MGKKKEQHIKQKQTKQLRGKYNSFLHRLYYTATVPQRSEGKKVEITRIYLDLPLVDLFEDA